MGDPGDYEPEDEFQVGADINRLATSQRGSGLPSWLNPNPNSLVGELKSTYKSIPGMFDTSGVRKAYDDQINTVQGMGGQIATNAAAEAIARSGQSGGQANSAMAKAQAMLPVFEQTSGLAKDKANTLLDAAKAQAALTAQVASTLGNLRTSYLANLAQVHMQKKQLKSSSTTNAAELALRKYQGDQQNDLSIEQLAQQGSQFDQSNELARTQLGLSELDKADFGMYYTGSEAGGSPGSGAFAGGDRRAYDMRNSRSSTIAGLLGV